MNLHPVNLLLLRHISEFLYQYDEFINTVLRYNNYTIIRRNKCMLLHLKSNLSGLNSN